MRVISTDVMGVERRQEGVPWKLRRPGSIGCPASEAQSLTCHEVLDDRGAF